MRKLRILLPLLLLILSFASCADGAEAAGVGSGAGASPEMTWDGTNWDEKKWVND